MLVLLIPTDIDPSSRHHDALDGSNGGDVSRGIVPQHDDVCLKSGAKTPQLVAAEEKSGRRSGSGGYGFER